MKKAIWFIGYTCFLFFEILFTVICALFITLPLILLVDLLGWLGGKKEVSPMADQGSAK